MAPERRLGSTGCGSDLGATAPRFAWTRVLGRPHASVCLAGLMGLSCTPLAWYCRWEGMPRSLSSVYFVFFSRMANPYLRSQYIGKNAAWQSQAIGSCHPVIIGVKPAKALNSETARRTRAGRTPECA